MVENLLESSLEAAKGLLRDACKVRVEGALAELIKTDPDIEDVRNKLVDAAQLLYL